MTQKSPPAVEHPPDLIGRGGRVNAVVGMLRSLQASRVTLEVEATGNLLGDDSPAPGYGVGPDGQPVKTVAQRREEIERGIAAVTEKYADLMPDVEQRLGENGAAT